MPFFKGLNYFDQMNLSYLWLNFNITCFQLVLNNLIFGLCRLLVHELALAFSSTLILEFSHSHLIFKCVEAKECTLGYNTLQLYETTNIYLNTIWQEA